MGDQTAGLTNLAKLLPTTTILTYQTLNPLITNHGHCHLPCTIATIVFISICAIACFLASVTDSVVHEGTLYYGIARCKDFYVFNRGNNLGDNFMNPCNMRYRLRISDVIHVLLTVAVFLSLSFSDGYVQSCFKFGSDVKQWLRILPLGMGVVASLVFLLFPITRNGIGYLTESETTFPPENPAVQENQAVPPVPETLKWLSDLVKFLPTTTVLTFQTLNPSFTNYGQCQQSNKILTIVFMCICCIACSLASVTDTFLYNGKLYYGIAHLTGFKIFNIDNNDVVPQQVQDWQQGSTFGFRTDVIPVILPVLFFVSLVFSDGYFQSCILAGAESHTKLILKILPLVMGVGACAVVRRWPCTRKGIGYSAQS